MRANMVPITCDVKRLHAVWLSGLERNGTQMSIDLGLAALAALIVMGPFAVLAAAAVRFGVDSRPGIGDRDRRPWMIGR